MTDSNTNSETTTPLRRSFLSAYGSFIAVGCVLLVALVALFSSMVPPKDTTPDPNATPPSAIGVEQESREEKQKHIDAAVARSRGDWNKLTPEEQGKFSSFSMGHGREFYASQWKVFQEKEKAAKEKATPAKK
jgi:hypothetical protein